MSPHLRILGLVLRFVHWDILLWLDESLNDKEQAIVCTRRSTTIQRCAHFKINHLIVFVSMVFLGSEYDDPVVAGLVGIID